MLLTADGAPFARLRTAASPRLLIATTRVSDGALRIFRNHELSVDTILASACLPLIHRTIEIDGEGYWDGGYSANPPIVQLVHESDALDVLIVQVTPARGQGVPINRNDIVKRLRHCWHVFKEWSTPHIGRVIFPPERCTIRSIK